MQQHEIAQRLFTLAGAERQLCFCTSAVCDATLNVKRVNYVLLTSDGMLPEGWQSRMRYTYDIGSVRPVPEVGLSGPYVPGCGLSTLDTIVPDNLDEPTRTTLLKLREAVGGNIEAFVCDRLAMPPEQLARSLKAEQVDAVALAIYNIEARKQALIIGDQTGTGKGRQAAAMLRYAHTQGRIPIFLTARENLFSDLYRDCKALGIEGLRPLIVNDGCCMVDFDIEDAGSATGYKVVYKAPGKEAAPWLRKAGDWGPDTTLLPREFDYVVATYSQFNSKKPTPKKYFLEDLCAEYSVLVMDEAHLASGEGSNTGEFFRGCVEQESCGVAFLSATFAKRPSNMELYAAKTCLRAYRDKLCCFKQINPVLQEVLASEMAAAGQMVRRERQVSNIEVRYLTLDAQGEEAWGVRNRKQEAWAAYDAGVDCCDCLQSIELENVRGKEGNKGKEGKPEGEVADNYRMVSSDYLSDFMLGKMAERWGALANASERGERKPFGLPLSSIDHIVEALRRAGVAVADCTGRTLRLDSQGGKVRIVKQPKANVKKLYNDFQNNRLDVLVVNAAGSVGVSAHAAPTSEVPAEKVKQRVMIIAEPEPDVAVELQKRGRICRTGQLASLPPIYEYITTAVPVEKRNLMILKRKLRSIDANTCSDQTRNEKIADCEDVINRYGSLVVLDYKMAKWSGLGRAPQPTDDGHDVIAEFQKHVFHKCEWQEKWFNDFFKRYNEKVDKAKQDGTYNLELLTKDWKVEQLPGSEMSDEPVSFFGGVRVASYWCQTGAEPFSFEDPHRGFHDIDKYEYCGTTFYAVYTGVSKNTTYRAFGTGSNFYSKNKIFHFQTSLPGGKMELADSEMWSEDVDTNMLKMNGRGVGMTTTLFFGSGVTPEEFNDSTFRDGRELKDIYEGSIMKIYRPGDSIVRFTLKEGGTRIGLVRTFDPFHHPYSYNEAYFYGLSGTSARIKDGIKPYHTSGDGSVEWPNLPLHGTVRYKDGSYLRPPTTPTWGLRPEEIEFAREMAATFRTA